MPSYTPPAATIPRLAVITYATPLALSAADGSHQQITLTGNLTISGITGLADTQTLVLYLIQGGAGSYTVTWPTIVWAGGIAPTLTTTVGRMDRIAITRNGDDLLGAVVTLDHAI